MVAPGNADRPTGTVTFLFTDVEGSTRLWEDHPTEMAAALELHDEILRSAIEAHGGYVFSTAGDAFAAAFQNHNEAATAASTAQLALANAAWPEPATIRVRMGLHTGDAFERDGDYFGPTLNAAARIMSAGHGGQILLSATTNTLLTHEETASLGAHRLKDLSAAQEIFQLGGAADDHEPIRTLDQARHNLPIVPDELIGRDEDAGQVAALLESAPVATIVGPGGMGKTRLALDVAAGLVDRFDDGVWLCELAPVGDPDAVADVVAQVLGVRPSDNDMVDQIGEFCRRRRLLLLLDNCEHVIDAAADLAEAIVSVAPGAAVLATSRESLDVVGEQTHRLRSLSTDDDGAAFELFRRRSVVAAPWSGEETAAVRRICRRLDGIPLAIELAANRTRSLSPVEIEARLDDAFRSLRGGRRSSERHRTLQAAIDWSHGLLTETQQTVLRRLAVFAGSADLEAVEAVCGEGLGPGATVDALDDLVEKSMVIADRSADAPTRFRLLEPIRQYAEDRLAAAPDDEAAQTRTAHLHHLVAWAEAWAEEIYGPTEHPQRDLYATFADARAAMGWAIDNEMLAEACRVVIGLRQAQDNWRFFEVGDWAWRLLHFEGIDDHPLGPEIASVGAGASWWRNDFDRYGQCSDRAEAMRHFDPTNYEHAITTATYRAQVLNDRERLEHVLRTLRSDHVGDEARRLHLLVNRAGPDAMDALSELRELAESTGSQLVWITHDTCWSLLLLFTDLAEAAVVARRAVHRAARIDASYWMHWPLIWLGVGAGMSGTVRAADLVLMRDALARQQDSGDETDQWVILVGATVALHSLTSVSQFARDVHTGLQTSPWAPTGAMTDILRDFVPLDQDGTGETSLGELVPRAIELLDETIADLGAIGDG